MSFEDPSLIKSIQEVRITQVHNKGGILNIYLTLDNNYCLTCGQDGSLILCNPYKSTIIHKYEGVHKSDVYDCYITSCRSKFVSCSVQDLNGYLWDISTSNIIRRIGRHERGILTCQGICNDNIIITSSIDKNVSFWDIRERDNKKPIHNLIDSLDSVTQVKFINTYEIITSSLDGFLRTYDLRKGQLTSTFMHFPITSIQLTHDKLSQCLLLNYLNTPIIELIDRTNHNQILNHYNRSTDDDHHYNRTDDDNNHPNLSSFDLSDNLIISISTTGSNIFIWDISTEDCNNKIHIIQLQNHIKLNGIQMLYYNQIQNGQFITYSQDGTIRLFNNQTLN